MRTLLALAVLLLTATCLFAREGMEFNHSPGGKFFIYVKSASCSNTILYAPHLNASTGNRWSYRNY